MEHCTMQSGLQKYSITKFSVSGIELLQEIPAKTLRVIPQKFVLGKSPLLVGAPLLGAGRGALTGQ